MLQPFVTGDRRRRVEAGTEASHDPVDGCEHDLDAVVDPVLEQEQRHSDRGELDTSVGEVDDGRDRDDRRAGEDADDGDAQHQWDRASAPLPS